MISKELLSEVLDKDYDDRFVDWFQIEDDNYLRTYYDCGNYDELGRPTGLSLEINIYELTHKCKEWALTKGYILESWTTKPAHSGVEAYCKSSNIDRFPFQADTEPEAVFRACEYILHILLKRRVHP